MAGSQDQCQNRLLANMPMSVRGRLQPYLEPVQISFGEVLYEPRQALTYVYFPLTAVVSLLNIMEDGASSEVAVVGNDGLVGAVAVLGGKTLPVRALVQTAGSAYRIKRQNIAYEFGHDNNFQRKLLLYVQALMVQMIQTAGCNRHHTIAQQLCRWLLLSMDRLVGDELVITQELIANLLGVRREGITDAAGKLQKLGLIHYKRGRIHILDRGGLEKQACECYGIIKREYDRLLA